MNSVSNKEFSRFYARGVIAIQGGGVYGLSLLGQLQAVYDAQIQPIAFAGTSAGAIIASLCWSGYSPKDLCKIFFDLAEEGGLTELLADAEGHSRINLTRLLFVGRGSSHNRWTSLSLQGLSRVSPIIKALRRFVSHGGIFAGDQLEMFVERRLRESPMFRPLLGNVSSNRCLTFGVIQQLAQERNVFIPPLYVVVTDLCTRRPVFVDSTDSAFADVSIAKVVRASAGFPTFFEPRQIGYQGTLDLCADGGIVLNFPAHIFSIKLPARYRILPYATVGLRLEPAYGKKCIEPRGLHVLGAIWKLLTGEARTWLENELARDRPHQISVSQRVDETQKPSNLMAINELDGNRVNEMFEAGRRYASNVLARHSFELPTGNEAAEILYALRDLIDQASVVLKIDDPNDDHALRANVFVAGHDGARVKLVLKYSVNMDDDPDQGMIFEIGHGQTGIVFVQGTIQACDLGKVARLMEEEDQGIMEEYKLSKEQQGKVRKDRKLLISVPIPDTTYLGRALARGTEGDLTDLLHGTNIFGVLNLDSSLGLDLAQGSTDNLRMRTLESIMVRTAVRVGSVLAFHFAKGENNGQRQDR